MCVCVLMMLCVCVLMMLCVFIVLQLTFIPEQIEPLVQEVSE
jgi:hypothetical protein